MSLLKPNVPRPRIGPGASSLPGSCGRAKAPRWPWRPCTCWPNARICPPATLDIYGNGGQPFQDHLNDLIRQWGLKMTEWPWAQSSPRPDLAAEFGNHDAYLFTSIWDEPFSVSLLGAMSTGLPTIATTAGGTPEAIVDGENGLLVPPDDAPALAEAMARLMQEPDLASRLGRQAAEDVRIRWSFDAYMDRIEGIYRAIVDGHRPGQPVDLQ